MKNKTITILGVSVLTVMIIISNQAYAADDTNNLTDVQKQANAHSALKTIAKNSITSSSDETTSMLTLVPSAANAVNFLMSDTTNNIINIGINATEYDGDLTSYKNYLGSTYPDVNFRVEQMTIEYMGCTSVTDNTCDPEVGGMKNALQRTSDQVIRYSSISLGVETNSNVKGAVMSGHTDEYNTGANVYNDITETTTVNLDLSTSTVNAPGSVYHGSITTNPGIESKSTGDVMACDCAFVTFPTIAATYENGVETAAAYVDETISLNKIYKGSSTTYSVTGTDTAATGDSLYFTGYVSGETAFTVSNGDTTIVASGTNGYTQDVFTNAFGTTTDDDGNTISDSLLQKGDSGGPVFSDPNVSDEVNIVGIVSVNAYYNDLSGYSGFVHWSDVQSALDLKDPPSS